MLQVVFVLLADEQATTWPVRKLAHAAGVGKTAAAQARERLTEMGLLTATRDGYRGRYRILMAAIDVMNVVNVMNVVEMLRTGASIPAAVPGFQEMKFLPQACLFARYIGSGKAVCTCGSVSSSRN